MTPMDGGYGYLSIGEGRGTEGGRTDTIYQCFISMLLELMTTIKERKRMGGMKMTDVVPPKGSAVPGPGRGLGKEKRGSSLK